MALIRSGYPSFRRSIDLAAHGIHEDFGAICRGNCPNGGRPTVQNSDTGRWYIAAGHPGFNNSANNGNGYATEKQARRAMELLRADATLPEVR